MKRKEFLKKISFGAAFALSAGCIGGCSKREFNGPPEHILASDELPGIVELDITIDVTKPKYSNLKFDGGWILIDNKIVVASTENTKEYVAASRLCSDEVLPGIIFSGNEWYCTEHDATFSLDGAGTQTYNDKGSKGLRVYKTELIGNNLRIYS